jgi:ArsR family transcriptional regulator
MPKTLEVLERKLGERCCDGGVRPRLPFDRAEALAAELDVLAHAVRIQLLDVLARNEGRICVCDLEAAVPVKQPTVSHHLRLLREAGLVESEKVGVWSYYRVNRTAWNALRDRVGHALQQIT